MRTIADRIEATFTEIRHAADHFPPSSHGKTRDVFFRKALEKLVDDIGLLARKPAADDRLQIAAGIVGGIYLQGFPGAHVDPREASITALEIADALILQASERKV